ncbi:MAG: type II glyceraldehyde-3-phosphate dehydrogenase [Ferroplasma sp.]|uniref:type II glyceraldehyde-3-phosphate dehydrogenase n=1 Tax=Ferroplasma sp. TaxID=2591003 RepID=UPI002814C96D|nr:type II glyceraldehyde-3-phosphate dehydrogenase [Ferroplasma sp.]WMT52083.1 MAG: type II glyceraldehyde-3-phosphate dehydrogenase [Ferroplasma sp.]
MIGVAINGYGTIGRRVAYGVSVQDDMYVTGIVKNSPDYVTKQASRYYNIYVPDSDKKKEFEESDVKVKGTLKDLLAESDIVIDGTPEGNGEKNLKLYKEYGIKAILEGGERSEAVESSFNAYSNYSESMGKNYVRVVSCNTTALARTLTPLHEAFRIESASSTILRRATDPNDNKKGPINAIEPSMSYPSHHAGDLKTVMKDINIETTAVKVPTTLMHVHVINLELASQPGIQEVINALSQKRRIIVLNGGEKINSTAQVMDYARELSRNRSDLYEIAIWRDSINIYKNRLHYIQAVHQESDVIPENIDAIRAMFGMEQNLSVNKTDASLDIKGVEY